MTGDTPADADALILVTSDALSRLPFGVLLPTALKEALLWQFNSEQRFLITSTMPS